MRPPRTNRVASVLASVRESGTTGMSRWNAESRRRMLRAPRVGGGPAGVPPPPRTRGMSTLPPASRRMSRTNPLPSTEPTS